MRVRYLRLYNAFLTNNLSRAMEFRAQFFAGIVGYMIWNGVSLLFINVVFGKVGAVRGWTREEMWVLLGTFVILESLCFGLLGPNMLRFSGMVRDGSLDVALTRPVNTQFLVSTRYMDINALLNSSVGVALLFYGLHRLGRTPAPHEWALWLLLLARPLVQPAARHNPYIRTFLLTMATAMLVDSLLEVQIGYNLFVFGYGFLVVAAGRQRLKPQSVVARG